jgi:hypothetical protein
MSTGCSLIPNFPKTTAPNGKTFAAINKCIQNFEIRIGSQWLATATIPPSCLEQNLRIKELLQKSQGRVKDTKFNRVDVSNLTGTFINDGYRVNGNWKLQHREVIFVNPINDHTNYTPWSEDTGNFSQEIAIRIDDGTIIVQPTNSSLSRDQQGFIRDLLGDILVYGDGNFRDQLVIQVRDGLNSLNGTAIADMLIENGAAKQLATKAPINEQQAITLINNASKRINAQISPKGLHISLTLKS